MKVFIALSALLAIAVARPSVDFYAAVPALATQTQYHAQDELGQYSYGYSDPLSAKQEVKTFDGVTRGSYSYRDAEGILQTVDYTADAINGFRVAATNLPKQVPVPEVIPAEAPLPVSDTVEVAAAKTAHFAAIEEAKSRASNPAIAPIPAVAEVKSVELPVELPKPVEDTVEVAKAKAEHFVAFEEAKLRAAAAPEVPLVPAIKALPAPVAFAAPAPVAFAAPAPIVAAPLAAPIAPLAYRSAAIIPTSNFAYNFAISNPYLYNSRFLAPQIIH